MSIELIALATECFLSLIFLFSGSTKVFLTGERLTRFVPISVDVPVNLLRKIGSLELLASFGIAIPVCTGIFPMLALFADAGIVLLMIGAAIYHINRKQWGMLGTNIVISGMALFVIFEMMLVGK
jgi:putative oxidoreductase